jgi:hypothetical protein
VYSTTTRQVMHEEELVEEVEEVVIVDLPPSLEELYTNDAPVPNLHLPNLRTVHMEGPGLKLPAGVRELRVYELPKHLPRLEVLHFNLCRNVDLRHLPLHSVTISGHSWTHGAVAKFPPLRHLTVYVQTIHIHLDTSRLETLHMHGCTHAHLVTHHLVALTVHSVMDLTQLTRLKSYTGPYTDTLPESVTHLHLYNGPGDLSHLTQVRSLTHTHTVSRFPPRVEILNTHQVTNLPETVRHLTLTRVHRSMPRLHHLESLTLKKCQIPTLYSVDTLHLRCMNKVELGQLRVRKLILHHTRILEFPAKLRVFRPDHRSRYPDTRGLEVWD